MQNKAASMIKRFHFFHFPRLVVIQLGNKSSCKYLFFCIGVGVKLRVVSLNIFERLHRANQKGWKFLVLKESSFIKP